MGWLWIIAVVSLFWMVFVAVILGLVQTSQMRRLIALNVVNEYYNWMHAQPEFRSFNRVRTGVPGKSREMTYSWIITYVKDGKNGETEMAFSPKMAIRMFKEAIS